MKNCLKPLFIAILGLAVGTVAQPLLHGASAVPELESAFQKPPASSRPWVYWFIMDGNFSREGITPDLEAMQRAGIGGLILLEVDVGLPKGPVKFMSPEWRELFKHTVNEAQRLGLEVTLIAGPGWTGSGGPWVKPEQSMQHLMSSSTEVEGPLKYEGVLPRPAPRKPYFGEGGMPAEFLKQHYGWFEDVAVLAFPTPSADARISNIEEKALYLRHPYSSGGAVNADLPMPATYPQTKNGEVVPVDRVINLTEKMKPDGTLAWDVPPGKWTILRCVRVSTGANTRPAPAAGIGFESDKLDKAALDAHFDYFVGGLLRTLDGPPQKNGAGWTMLHIDSWEMGAQNWTGKFREEFQKRRGYDLLPYVPAYSGIIVQNNEVTERFLWDMRVTAQELVIENHATHLRDLGRKHGFQLSIEPYDMNPTSDLDLGGVADVPMCEFWAVGDCFDSAFSCIETVSAAHTNGRKVIAAEAFTGGGDMPWQRYPGNMKNQADWALATGINRITFHRYAHQSFPGNVAPGMTMSRYGTQYERTLTWWEMSDAWHAYLARCQHLLRQGLPVADILYLSPEGAPNVFRAPASAFANSELLPDRRGHNFDGCSPQVILRDAQVRDGRIVLPDGMSYRIMVLPENETMTPELLTRLKSLVEAGASIMGPRPLKSPSLVNFPACDDQVRRLAAELWGPDNIVVTSPIERKVGKGRVIATARQLKPMKRPSAAPEGTTLLVPERRATFGAPYMPYGDVASILARDGVAPDFETAQPLRYIHRTLGDSDLYFVGNTTGEALEATCFFRVDSSRVAELWDPVTGATRALTTQTSGKTGASETVIRFEPWQSYFVVFAKAPTKGTIAKASPDTVLKEVTSITGAWVVRFEDGRGAPGKPVTFASLTSWTENPEDGIRYYSGTAAYEKTITITKDQLTTGRSLYLDLGRVEVMAEVTLNGKKLGTLWTAPYRIDISAAARVGENTLSIRVVNLWPNRMIGDAKLPPDTRRHEDGWAKGVAQEWPQWLLDGKPSPLGHHQWSAFDPYGFDRNHPLFPSGLIGPVRLLEPVIP